MKIKISSEPIDALNHEGLALFFFSDERPPRGYCGLVDWRLNGIISRHIAMENLTGDFMEKVLITPNYRIPSSKILLFGLGKSTHLTYDNLYTAGSVISETVKKINCGDAAFDIPGPERCPLKVPEITEAMLSGFANASWEDQQRTGTVSVCLLGYDSYRDEIVLGANQFKVNVKNKLKVTILEA